ncbi:MAG: M14 family metallopeptidase [Lachnospiraceae bacterium]|nr:M14 family metallopeptidase [Lachnospiraceae bacterium]
MIETVVSVGLPVDENLVVKKNRLQPDVLTGNEKRLCVVTGIHGDELEGQYVCYELIRRIEKEKEKLKGIVDVYPAINPLGIDSITRGIPMFDLDMNRIFPGSLTDGALSEYVAAKVVEDMEGADMAMDIHASNIYLREIPQVRINEKTAKELVPYAKLVNCDYVWVHSASTVLEATLAHSLNTRGVKTLVVEMGVGMRITEEYGNQLLDGIFNLMIELGIWSSRERPKVKEPIISTDHEVGFVNADVSGLFVPCVEHWKDIKAGALLGQIVNPLTGKVEQEVLSPIDGMVFTLREYPIVVSGSLIARVLGGKSHE